MQNLTPSQQTALVDFADQKRTLEERLEAIKLDPQVEEAEARRTGAKLVRDKVAGLFK